MVTRRVEINHHHKYTGSLVNIRVFNTGMVNCIAKTRVGNGE